MISKAIILFSGILVLAACGGESYVTDSEFEESIQRIQDQQVTDKSLCLVSGFQVVPSEISYNTSMSLSDMSVHIARIDMTQAMCEDDFKGLHTASTRGGGKGSCSIGIDKLAKQQCSSESGIDEEQLKIVIHTANNEIVTGACYSSCAKQ